MNTTPRRRPPKVRISKTGAQAPPLVAALSASSEAHKVQQDPLEHGGHTARYPGLQASLKPIPLLALGIYFAAMVMGGSLQNYISPQQAWLAWLGSALFLALGLANAFHLFTTITNKPFARPGYSVHAGPEQHAELLEPHEHHEHESYRRVEYQGYHGHHHRIPWLALMVATLPLLLGVLVPSRPLGAAALRGRAAPVEFVKGYPTLPDTDPSEWNMLQWQRAFNSGAKPPSWFEGQKATVTGFIVDTPGAPSGHFVIARWVMRHCAADAYGIGLLASGGGGDTLSTDTWVRVKGSMGVIKVGSDDALVLRAESVDSSIGQPEPAYIFPLWNPKSSN